MSVTREEALAAYNVIAEYRGDVDQVPEAQEAHWREDRTVRAYLEQPDARDLVERLLIPAKAHLDRLRTPPVHPYAGEAVRRLEGVIEEAERYAAGESRSPWVSVDSELPPSLVPVNVAVVVRDRKRRRVITAQYAAARTLELSDDVDPWEGCEQDEDGQWWCAPGWYETRFTEDDSLLWEITDRVLGWQPLPPPPEQGE